MPKSSGEDTRPCPKYCCQTRLTMTRAVSGFSLAASHCAKPSRLRGALAGNGCRNDGVPGVTASPGRFQSPRLKMRVSRTGRGVTTSVVAGYGHCFIRSAMALFVSANSGTVRRAK
ncbi:MAG: hypothetical protein U0X75_15530 [Acidobacteriota bacterium]